MDRRDFLKLLGITSGSVMISSCGVDKANEKIIPYVIPPEEEVYPGKPVYYSTTCTECPANCGLQVEVNEKVYHEKRSLFPTKLEGTEGHPINDGGLCMRGQAGLFRLYNPNRIRRPMMKDGEGKMRIASWDEAFSRIREELRDAAENGLENVYFSGRTTSTLSDVIDRFCTENNVSRLPEYETYSQGTLKQANQIVFGRPEVPRYHIEKADFLISIGADLFETHISPVFHAAGFGKAMKNRHFKWFHLEPHFSLTGSQASERINLKPQSEMILLAYLLQSVLERNENRNNININLLRYLPQFTVEGVTGLTGISKERLQKLLTGLVAAEKPLVISGGLSHSHSAGLEVAVLTSLLQYVMGMMNELVDFTHAESYEKTGTFRDVKTLVERMSSGKIGVCFISRTDPLATLPSDLNFAGEMQKSRLTVGLSDTMNQTVKNCDIILPLSHSLESWGDAAPYRGLLNVIQPAIEPQLDSRSEGDILLQFSGEKSSYREFLFNSWNEKYGGDGTSEMLQKGYREYPTPVISLSINYSRLSTFLREIQKPVFNYGVALCIAPSIRFYDGRSRDLDLLNEIPDPLTSISYGEWLSVSEKTAGYFFLKDRDEVELTAGNYSVRLPVKIMKFLPENVYVVQRGLIPVPTTPVDSRTGEEFWYLANASLKKTGAIIPLPILSGSKEEESRGLLPHEDEHGHGHGEEITEWYPDHEHIDYRWGMAIDLDSCIGCGACAAACYVENNIAIVGKEEHLIGREMSWIRVQPYYDDHEKIEFVPMLCQHCDNAPCEPVCPVYAAYHNQEGLNVQVYNRCVGTRYCANNCPYKVRRFNWFDHRLVEPLDKMYNPDISVRDRGVMEKCTFCIQRIRAAKDHARDENRLVRDGEVSPACAQTCPTNAITFGNLKDEKSKVYKLAHSDRAYQALAELGTEPAVNYLRKRGNKHEA